MKYYIWAFITLAVIVVIGVVSHASTSAFTTSLVMWGIGVGYQIYQMVKGGKDDTTLLPYAIQALGVATIMIWQGFFA